MPPRAHPFCLPKSSATALRLQVCGVILRALKGDTAGQLPGHLAGLWAHGAGASGCSQLHQEHMGDMGEEEMPCFSFLFLWEKVAGAWGCCLGFV